MAQKYRYGEKQALFEEQDMCKADTEMDHLVIMKKRVFIFNTVAKTEHLIKGTACSELDFSMYKTDFRKERRKEDPVQGVGG